MSKNLLVFAYMDSAYWGVKNKIASDVYYGRRRG